MHESLALASVVLFSLAGISAVVAVVFFFLFNIKKVRDDLTGRTAERAIAELRMTPQSRRSPKFLVQSQTTGGGLRVRSTREKSEAIHVRRGTTANLETGTMLLSEDEPQTTLLHTNEGYTSLLADYEPGTTLLAKDDENAEAKDDSESHTTLLNSSEV